MLPIRVLLIAPLGMLFACGEPAPTDTGTLPRPRADTPFEYSLSFAPTDPVYGAGGVVQGVGAIWSWSSPFWTVLAGDAKRGTGSVSTTRTN